MALKHLLLGLLLTTSHAATSNLRLSGTTVTLAGVPYWIAPESIENFHEGLLGTVLQNNSVVSGGYVPLSVVHSASGDLTTEVLDQEFARFLANDDVWTTDFSLCACNYSDLCRDFGMIS